MKFSSTKKEKLLIWKFMLINHIIFISTIDTIY